MTQVAPAPTRTRRDPRRAATRERLLVAALAIVRERGSGAVTKAAVCQRAGLHRSGFYGYFADVDACLSAAAERVIEIQRSRDARAREAFATDVVMGRRDLVKLMRELLDVHDDKETADISVRCGHEDSIIGRALRAEREAIIEHTTRENWARAAEAGVIDSEAPELHMVASMSLLMIESAILQVIQRPDVDADLLATGLGNAIFHMVAGQIRVLLSDQRRRAKA